MDNIKKIVTQMPLTNLWTDSENIIASRKKYLTASDIQTALKKDPVKCAVAEIGKPLHWISNDKLFNYWKTEIKQRLADEINNINLNNFMDNYAYVASEWTSEEETKIILLEKYH